MLTVPEVARRLGRNPETIRRWIREGRLRSARVGTQHLVDDAVVAELAETGRPELPPAWRATVTGEPMPDWVRLVRGSRAGH